ncbi:MAG: ribonuclease HII [Candidatus Caldatribacteriota bacterium]|nr:ribonuclease HII [Candidatus Caldatribacteriota bacterium]
MSGNTLLKRLLQKYPLVAGIDEAGRGPLAGPVIAGIVAIKYKDLSSLNKLGVKDSKKLSANKRELLYEQIKEKFPMGTGICSVETIDRINILQGTFLAMKRALTSLKESPNYLIVDGGIPIPSLSTPQVAKPKADELISLVSAASIIAKVTRDRIIVKLAEQYPQYGFEKHKGYGTKEHFVALQKYGPCSIHRKSFRPIKKLMRPQKWNPHQNY